MIDAVDLDNPTASAAPQGFLRARSAAVRLAPGLAVACALAVVAEALSGFASIVGAPVLALLGGTAVAQLRRPRGALAPGLGVASSRVLQASVVALGATLSLQEVVRTGLASLPVMLGSLAVALVGAVVVGRVLGVDRDARTLIGVGTGICGVSAIAATDSVIEASEADVAYAVATIFTFNVVAVLTYPTVGHLLNLSPHGFGLWAGTAVNDVSSVVAAASIYGHGATGTAVVVKLTRTLMIIPITLGLGWYRGRRAPSAPRRPALATTGAGGSPSLGVHPVGRVRAVCHGFPLAVGDAGDPVAGAGVGQGEGGSSGHLGAGGGPTGFAPRDLLLGGPTVPRTRRRRLVPLFIVWFVVAVLINTTGLIPGAWHHPTAVAAGWMITVALAAIGCSVRLDEIRRAGLRPLALGAALWALVAASSLGLQLATLR